MEMMVVIIDRFNAMLQNLIKGPGLGEIHYIDLRGALSNLPANYKEWWANELHPTGRDLLGGNDGFGAAAEKFQLVLPQLP